MKWLLQFLVRHTDGSTVGRIHVSTLNLQRGLTREFDVKTIFSPHPQGQRKCAYFISLGVPTIANVLGKMSDRSGSSSKYFTRNGGLTKSAHASKIQRKTST
jgi:hypothetical protein